MYSLTASRFAAILAFALGAGHLAGCGSPARVEGNVLVENRSQALQIGSVLKVSGVYEDGKCLDPVTGALRTGVAWSAAISATPGSAPAVVLNDTGCVLDLTSLDIQDSAGVTKQATAGTTIALKSAFGAPVMFSYTDTNQGPLSFYVNARISPADFSANFDISVVYSDSPGPLSSISLNGQYATIGSNSIVDTRVPAPSDTLSFSGVTYAKNGQKKVTNVTGNPTLTLGNPTGQSYVIVSGTCPTTLSAVNTAYAGGTQVAIATAPTSSDFGLSTNLDLSTPVNRCMIIANCNTASGVCSYQLYGVTFN